MKVFTDVETVLNATWKPAERGRGNADKLKMWEVCEALRTSFKMLIIYFICHVVIYLSSCTNIEAKTGCTIVKVTGREIINSKQMDPGKWHLFAYAKHINNLLFLTVSTVLLLKSSSVDQTAIDEGQIPHVIEHSCKLHIMHLKTAQNGCRAFILLKFWMSAYLNCTYPLNSTSWTAASIYGFTHVERLSNELAFK